jgi:hypothetical protein
LDSDLLVLRGFLSVEGGFWPLFRPLLGRTFEHDFATFHLGGVMVVRLLASVGLLVDDSYKGRYGSVHSTFVSFVRCWVFRSR